MEPKKSWLSKTLWFNAIVGVLALVAPLASTFISTHPVEYGVAVAGINIGLRLISSGRIELW